jgi:hypothetical protein
MLVMKFLSQFPCTNITKNKVTLALSHLGEYEQLTRTYRAMMDIHQTFISIFSLLEYIVLS